MSKRHLRGCLDPEWCRCPHELRIKDTSKPDNKPKAYWYCKCGRNGSTRPPPPEDEIFATSTGGYRADRFEETHSRKECLRYDTVVKPMETWRPTNG